MLAQNDHKPAQARAHRPREVGRPQECDSVYGHLQTPVSIRARERASDLTVFSTGEPVVHEMKDGHFRM